MTNLTMYYDFDPSCTIVEPNPHFIPYFEENRKKFKNLKINDIKLVTMDGSWNSSLLFYELELIELLQN